MLVVLLFLHQNQNLDCQDGSGELKVKKVGCMAMRLSPAGDKGLGKPVIAKKTEISTTSEDLAAPAYRTWKRRSYVNDEIPESKNG